MYWNEMFPMEAKVHLTHKIDVLCKYFDDLMVCMGAHGMYSLVAK